MAIVPDVSYLIVLQRPLILSLNNLLSEFIPTLPWISIESPLLEEALLLLVFYPHLDLPVFLVYTHVPLFCSHTMVILIFKNNYLIYVYLSFEEI